MYLGRIETFAYGEINERSFSSTHPRYLKASSLKNKDSLPCINAMPADDLSPLLLTWFNHNPSMDK